jgi:hypothetical protein
MGPRAALDLRKITLADGFAEILLNEAGHFELGELTVESAQGALDLPQVPKFFTESHIAICDYYMAICDCCQEKNREKLGLVRGRRDEPPAL